MEKIELTITDYGYDGEGVARQGKVCFVPYTLQGEKVAAVTFAQNAKFCKCRPVKILSPSPNRREPPCPYFSICGGCQFQHTDYATEAQIKEQISKRQLEKAGYFGKIKFVKCKKEYFYRNKIKLFCRGNNLALFEQASKNLVPIERCMLVREPINQAIEKIQTFVKAKDLGKDVKQITIRAQGESVLVLFEFFRKQKVEFQGLQLMLGAKCGIFSKFDQKITHESGIDCLQENIFDLNCRYGVADFHQVNDEIAQKLYKAIADACKGETVINAYSGAGLLSAILAKSKKLVYAIELGVAEHNSAQALKAANNLDNLFNIQGDCAKHIPLLIGKAQSIVVDPPRAGLDKKVATAIEGSGIEQVIYVSCNQATLVRDIALLPSYSIQSVTCYDMFARTSSIETMCVLSKKK